MSKDLKKIHLHNPAFFTTFPYGKCNNYVGVSVESKTKLEADAAVPKPNVASTACLTKHWKGINTLAIFHPNHNLFKKFLSLLLE